MRLVACELHGYLQLGGRARCAWRRPPNWPRSCRRKCRVPWRGSWASTEPLWGSSRRPRRYFSPWADPRGSSAYASLCIAQRTGPRCSGTTLECTHLSIGLNVTAAQKVKWWQTRAQNVCWKIRYKKLKSKPKKINNLYLVHSPTRFWRISPRLCTPVLGLRSWSGH